MYQNSKRTCTVIFLLIKLFVWCRSCRRRRRRRRRGLLKPSDISLELQEKKEEENTK